MPRVFGVLCVILDVLIILFWVKMFSCGQAQTKTSYRFDLCNEICRFFCVTQTGYMGFNLVSHTFFTGPTSLKMDGTRGNI